MRHSFSQPLIFVVISFIVIALMYSSLSTSAVFAIPPDSGWFAGKCTEIEGGNAKKCCWSEPGDGTSWCQICRAGNTGVVWDCDEKTEQQKIVGGRDIVPPVEEGLAPPPPPGPGQGGPGNVLPEGVFEGPTTPSQQQKITPEITPLPLHPTCPPGQKLDEDTNLCFRASQQLEEQQQQSEVTEEEKPVPVCQEGQVLDEDLGFCVPTECPEGQVLDENSGVCVLEQPEVTEEQPQAPEEEQQQSEPQEPDQQQQSSDEGGDSSDGNSNDNSNNDNND